MKKFYYFLYITTNKINGKYYKGEHATDNLFDGYLGSGKAFKRAFRKYGRNAFERKIVLFLPDLESLVAAEKLFITEEDISSPDCYNLREGGSRQPGKPGIKRAPFTKTHRDNISLGQVEHYRRRLAAGEVTYKVTNKIRKTPIKNIQDSIKHTGELNPMFGVTGSKNPTSKPVYCVELNRVFESAMLAAKELGIAFQNISKVCQGKRHTCGGYHWSFT